MWKCTFCPETNWLSIFDTRDNTKVAICEFCQQMSKTVSNPYIKI